MSNLPASNCQWLLTDKALTPILSTVSIPSPSDARPSRQAQAHLQSLTSLTTTAISAFESASRLGLGIPQRIIVETNSSGPVILHSFVNPPSKQRQQGPREQQDADRRGIVEQARDELRPLTATTDGGSQGSTDAETHANGTTPKASSAKDVEDEGSSDEDDTNSQRSPLLIASIIAPNLAEARKVAGGLERTGHDIQRELALEKQRESSQDIPSHGEDG